MLKTHSRGKKVHANPKRHSSRLACFHRQTEILLARGERRTKNNNSKSGTATSTVTALFGSGQLQSFTLDVNAPNFTLNNPFTFSHHWIHSLFWQARHR